METQDLRKVGLKATVPRLRILHLLETCERRHLSAEEVYRTLLDAGEDVGLATVYRVLTQFESAGIVVRHHFEGGQSVFELNVGSHHDHIVCNQCGRIEEFVDETIERCQHDVAHRAGFAIRDHSLIIYGDCERVGCPYRAGGGAEGGGEQARDVARDG
jgi:Fur family ferric uptake transcriptional regulator